MDLSIDGLDALLGEDPASVKRRENADFNRLVSPFERSLVLVGAGNLGRQVLEALRHDSIEPLAFADNNPALQGKLIEGVPILSRQQAAERYGLSAAFVVTIWNTSHSFIQTRDELTALGCRKVVSSVPLRWRYADSLLPFFWLDVPSRTIEQASMARAAYGLWSDEFSRQEYVAQLRFRIRGDLDALAAPVPQQSYFPSDLFEQSPTEQFVDCGAFDGITVENFLARQTVFSGRIVAYEPDPENLRRLNEYRSHLPEDTAARVFVRPNAVGAKHENVHFNATGTMGSAVDSGGQLQIECISLDEDLPGLQFQPTYVKMDIEGSELDALAGASAVIRESLPVLAICLYHRHDDLWRIPLFIHSLAPQYRLFLRPHEIEGWQLVCYAVPPARCKK